jgi:MoxR-like ATPase
MQTAPEEIKDTLTRARDEIGKVIIGQKEVIERALIAIFSGQHALVEGVPGVAKTLLVRTLARVLGCEYNRIQFTPDLMPADITGTNVFNLQRNEFTLIKGPVFTTFLLADEINRAPAKTQSALLQAMQERQVTIDRDSHQLSPNFTVFATQNPVEYEGTYPLPEAQKDRFMLKIRMDPKPRSPPAPCSPSSARTISPACATDSMPSSSGRSCSATWSISSAARASTTACSSAPARAPRNPSSSPARPRPQSLAAISSRPTISS